MRHFPNNAMFLSHEIGFFWGHCNSGYPHFWTIKPYAAIDTTRF